MRKFNITIIVLDTIRLDTFTRLAAGKGSELSKLGRFLFFDRCIAPSTWTLPSTASILTGTYPSEHGAHETKLVKSLDIEKIKLKEKTMVTDLKGEGYTTYAISANPYFHPIYGFDEFDYFKEEPYFTDVFGSVAEVSSRVKPRIAKYRNLYGSDVLKISMAILRRDPNLLIEAAATGAILTPIAVIKKLKARYIEGWPIEKLGTPFQSSS